ncbi:hypothetical protein [Fictibacillus barbaricus]|uniref:Uncharacterized protein n=1 Tax=Fictibacillus barbaricus TaxID=182136 RepID=A0ABU1U273_9BACL|nr:hypothetical protein [Fictibacillus barbaricus]MDR7073542.1 hypothetical protein [Fictibacillus barbaricus]
MGKSLPKFAVMRVVFLIDLSACKPANNVNNKNGENANTFKIPNSFEVAFDIPNA